MKPIKIHTEDAIRLLNIHKVLRTDELMKMLDCAPQTLYLKLSQCEYISSINRHRRFLTLAKTPQYDSNGLWVHENVMFSKWGNVKETIVHLVNSSTIGLTPDQISNLLKTIVTPQLLDCLKEKRAIRVRFGRNQVYFSSDKSISKSQIEKRNIYIQDHVKGTTKSVIQQESKLYDVDKVHFGFLAQLILRDAITAEDIYTMLDAMGKSVDRKDIKEIIILYNIVQKKIRFQLVFLTERRKDVRLATKD